MKAELTFTSLFIVFTTDYLLVKELLHKPLPAALPAEPERMVKARSL
jgi:hypothetical protein